MGPNKWKKNQNVFKLEGVTKGEDKAPLQTGYIVQYFAAKKKKKKKAEQGVLSLLGTIPRS